MKAAIFCLAAYVCALGAFLISGYMASWVYASYGCIWTSSGVFGLSFLTLATGFGSAIAALFDIADWFR